MNNNLNNFNAHGKLESSDHGLSNSATFGFKTLDEEKIRGMLDSERKIDLSVPISEVLERITDRWKIGRLIMSL
jgi:hypothetical protein